jgi:transcriptional regulator with XRE-family HTH domain
MTDDVRLELGQRVRELRELRQLSTRALGAAVGVTSGFISQIENGRVAPSLATLFRLTAALGVGMSELFDAVPRPERPTLLRAAERTAFEAIPGIRDAVLTIDATRQLEVSLIELDAGAATGDEPTTHGAAVGFVTVLEGTLEVQVADETFFLDAGDALTFGGATPHRFRNGGSETARVLWASTPASF